MSLRLDLKRQNGAHPVNWPLRSTEYAHADKKKSEFSFGQCITLLDSRVASFAVLRARNELLPAALTAWKRNPLSFTNIRTDSVKIVKSMSDCLHRIRSAWSFAHSLFFKLAVLKRHPCAYVVQSSKLSFGTLHVGGTGNRQSIAEGDSITSL
jgi:hypothetical protein